MKKFQPASQSLLKRERNSSMEEEQKTISEELTKKDLDLDTEIELDDLPV